MHQAVLHSYLALLLCAERDRGIRHSGKVKRSAQGAVRDSGSSELERWLCHAELMEGPVGYDMSHAVWHNAGWQEMRDLRKKLENLKELRDLIKKLGRASGKGPKRRAPQEVCLTWVPVR